MWKHFGALQKAYIAVNCVALLVSAAATFVSLWKRSGLWLYTALQIVFNTAVFVVAFQSASSGSYQLGQNAVLANLAFYYAGHTASAVLLRFIESKVLALPYFSEQLSFVLIGYFVTFFVQTMFTLMGLGVGVLFVSLFFHLFVLSFDARCVVLVFRRRSLCGVAVVGMLDTLLQLAATLIPVLDQPVAFIAAWNIIGCALLMAGSVCVLKYVL